MDRIEAMKVLVTAVEEGSLAAAARKLKRSPTAVSRALGLLEGYLGVELLHRTTRSLKLSEAGQRYVDACRRVLLELEEADSIAGGEQSLPRGVLTISAPPILGEEVLRPVLDQFLQNHPRVSVRLLMLDRFVNLVDEGVDVAMRIGNLADSTNVSIKIGGDVRRVVVAAPTYLAKHDPIQEPNDLLQHNIIAFSNFGTEAWNFHSARGSTIPRTIHLSPRYVVNSVRAAAASAANGLGVTRLYSYHVSNFVRDGLLRIVLDQYEPPALPVHLLTPRGRTSVAKVRAFIDFAAPKLRSAMAKTTEEYIGSQRIVPKSG